MIGSSFWNQLPIFKIALLNCAICQLSYALTIQLIVLIHTLVYCTVRVRDFAHAVELVVFEDALEHFTLYSYCTRLPIQIVVLKVALTELLLVHVVAEAVQLVKAVFINHLPSKCQLLVLIMINYESATNFGNLVILWPVLDADELADALDPKIILEFEFALFVEVVEIEFVCLQILE